jgi:hypothetical protein
MIQSQFSGDHASNKPIEQKGMTTGTGTAVLRTAERRAQIPVSESNLDMMNNILISGTNT